MRKGESKPAWLMELCENIAPGVILIDGDVEKTPCFDFAYEIGAMMVENGFAERLCVWSCDAFLWLYGRTLVGDPLKNVHCWTMTKDDGIKPPPLHPLSFRLIEDDMNRETRRALSRLIYTPGRVGVKLCVGGGDLTIAHFKNWLSLPNMERINGAAKRSGRTIIVVSGLTDAQGKHYETTSYGELVMRISVEQGIDLTECAESLITVRNGGVRYCRPLRIWNNDRLDDESAVMLDWNEHFKVIS